ncbi:hypothetical protein PNOK_0768700 [Pyrrhoderma noxium]|uniref:Uncharacterized protein n=1 Tax=Pyrrhoderma noxium TaxID=2282107 RepID=A0A286U913_9AGAM|nr:hypothetical protein PNOK_0768700 [Pyrrhoderma noxium]
MQPLPIEIFTSLLSSLVSERLSASHDRTVSSTKDTDSGFSQAHHTHELGSISQVTQTNYTNDLYFSSIANESTSWGATRTSIFTLSPSHSTHGTYSQHQNSRGTSTSSCDSTREAPCTCVCHSSRYESSRMGLSYSQEVPRTSHHRSQETHHTGLDHSQRTSSTTSPSNTQSTSGSSSWGTKTWANSQSPLTVDGSFSLSGVIAQETGLSLTLEMALSFKGIIVVNDVSVDESYWDRTVYGTGLTEPVSHFIIHTKRMTVAKRQLTHQLL